jgi:hypothetical protein
MAESGSFDCTVSEVGSTVYVLLCL